MAFFFGCVISTWIGRKIGWALSRGVLYTSGWAVCVILCVAWAVGVAYALRLSIVAMEPGWLLKVFGYGAGAYISVPNYGLIPEASISDTSMRRNLIHQGRANDAVHRDFRGVRVLSY